jgi:hypothetical protein
MERGCVISTKIIKKLASDESYNIEQRDSWFRREPMPRLWKPNHRSPTSAGLP